MGLGSQWTAYPPVGRPESRLPIFVSALSEAPRRVARSRDELVSGPGRFR